MGLQGTKTVLFRQPFFNQSTNISLHSLTVLDISIVFQTIATTLPGSRRQRQGVYLPYNGRTVSSKVPVVGHL